MQGESFVAEKLMRMEAKRVILQSNEIVSNYNDLPMLRAYHSMREPFRRENTEHRHTAFEVSIIAEGHGVYRVGEHRYDFAPGDVFLFSTNEAHCITEVVDQLHVINLQFEPRFIWMPGHDTFDLRYLDVFFHRSAQFQHQLRHDDPRAQQVRALLTQIDQEFIEKRDFYDMMVKNMLLTALVHIRRNYAQWFEHSPGMHKAQLVGQLGEVMRHIDENLFADLSLDGLAATAHMSRSHFCALFRELNGLSAWEYIVSRRISHAAQLLRTTTLPVTQIATDCGFNTIANFNYAFRRQTNKTPTQYRKGG